MGKDPSTQTLVLIQPSTLPTLPASCQLVRSRLKAQLEASCCMACLMQGPSWP